MEFSSSNAPISRETWAPRSPRSPRFSPRSPPRRELPPADVDMDGAYGRDRRDAPPPPAYSGPPPHKPSHAPRAEPNNVLGVFGLSIRTRERDLEDEFMRCGDVEKVVIVYDQRTDRSRGFGFITMRTIDDATRAIDKLNGVTLHGRAIRVDYSATQKPHAPTPGEYRGEKRYDFGVPPRGGRFDNRRSYDDRRFDDRGGGYDDRRGGGYGDRGGGDYGRDYRDRDRDYGAPRRDDDPYGGRSRRDDYDAPPRRRSPSPRRRYDSPERRAPPPPRDYVAPADQPRY
ncbi:hypothetical protein Q5752_003439 [Cryptotrichosporon argae]